MTDHAPAFLLWMKLTDSKLLAIKEGTPNEVCESGS